MNADPTVAVTVPAQDREWGEVIPLPVACRQDAPSWAGPLVSMSQYSRSDWDAIERGDLRPLREVLTYLHSLNLPPHDLEIPGQPVDRHLLALSPVYAKSRSLFRGLGGQFVPQLISQHRALTSPTLLEKAIQYSPLDRELAWLVEEGDRLSHFGEATLKYLREAITPVFHEQNHRILFHVMPAAPPAGPGFDTLPQFS